MFITTGIRCSVAQRDAKRIEEHAGMSPEEMTDEELERAMAELGIEKQMRDAGDVEQGAGATAAAPADSGSSLDDLERLAKLRDQGVLTEDEFTKKKQQILGL